MGKLMGIGKVLECFLNRRASSSCLYMEIEDDFDEEEPLMATQTTAQLLRLKDVITDKNHTLARQLKPKVVVVVRVSMHCNGCARRIRKHISKMEGVESYKVDLETKTVVVTGDVFPFEVLQCVSKVRSAEILKPQDLFTDPITNSATQQFKNS